MPSAIRTLCFTSIEEALAASNRDEFEDGSCPDDPIEFERWCAARLQGQGWTARMTKGSGDQGADVIAEKGGIRVVVQCKWYSQPVGNAAVQEAYAAKAHERTDYAFVVTNNAYTKSAKQLAASTGVGLLHADDLRDFFKATGLGEGVGQAAGWPRP